KIQAYGYTVDDWNRMMLFSSGDMVMRYARPRLEQKQPFFGFINLLVCHDPYLPSPRAYHERMKVPDLRNRALPPEITSPDTITDEKRKALVTEALAKVRGRGWSTS